MKRLSDYISINDTNKKVFSKTVKIYLNFRLYLSYYLHKCNWHITLEKKVTEYLKNVTFPCKLKQFI